MSEEDRSFTELEFIGFRVGVDRDSHDVIYCENLNLSEHQVACALALMPLPRYGDIVYLVVGFDLADRAFELVDLWGRKYKQNIDLVVARNVGLGCWYILRGLMTINKVYYGKGIVNV